MRVNTHGEPRRLQDQGRLFLIILIAALLIPLAMQSRQSTRAAANFPNGFKSIGYQPSWAGDVNALPYSKITHVNYSFLGYNSDGSLRAIDQPAKLQQLVNLAHQNGVKVFIAIGGWTGDSYDDVFEALAANSTARNNFFNNVRNFVNQYNLDGVDIDWEYPTIAANYTALMQGLSGFLRPAGKGLTTAVVSDGSAANAITSAAYPYIDWINIMAYDGGSPHANYDWAINSWNFWRNTKGVPANKLVLGVPFYSRPGQRAYREFVTMNVVNADVDCVNGDCYNGRPTIRRKTQFVMSQGGGGIMYWDTSHDTTGSLVQYSLMNTIYETAMGGSTNPTATRTPTPIPGNLAAGKPATSSSNENASYTPNLAVDGNAGTRWSSAFSDPQWIRVDLGNSYNISRVRLNWEAAYASAYQIQVSSDGANFTTIRSLTGQNGGIDDNTALSGTGRYVRIYGTTRATAYGYSLFELEVYGTLSTGPTATRTNTSTGPTATRTRTNTSGGTNPTATRTRTNTTSSGTPAWAPNTFYAVGAVVSYGGRNYRCLQAHTSQVGWEPSNVPALWQPI